MKRLFTPTLQICVGILSLTLSLILIGHAFGLLPDEDKAAIEMRGKLSEALAIQLAVATSRKEITTIQDTISLVVKRSHDVLSVAMRRADGKVIVQTDNHDTYWLEPSDGKSTSTHVLIPLTNVDKNWGRIEIAFRPLASSNSLLGLSRKMLWFIGFICIAGFAGYYIVLKRALRELDPGRVIPERVQAAFDCLAEGVIILDEHEMVVLANKAFGASIGVSAKSLFATNANLLPWLKMDAPVPPDRLPWRVAMRERKSVTGVIMGIQTPSNVARKLMVNAIQITDGRGVVRGVIATFYDFTELHEKNEQLRDSIRQLHESQAQIENQNKQLQFLSTCDPLTGCLNRRAFFNELKQRIDRAQSRHETIYVFMLDIDHFKRINDRFGHVVGDQVLVNFSEILKGFSRNNDPVGRYGGEEFCTVISFPSTEGVKRFAERICKGIATASLSWLPNGEPVTVSIGIASLDGEVSDIKDLVVRADRALYAAKAAGRNRFAYWPEISPKNQEVA